MYNGKRIAFDYGTVRIGVAITDQSGILASPSEVLLNDDLIYENLTKLLVETNPAYIAIGIPKQLSGKDGSKYQEVIAFVSKLKGIYQGNIFGIDERFTTVNAAAKLRESGHNSVSSKSIIDSAAAVSILDMALEFEKSDGLDKCAL